MDNYPKDRKPMTKVTATKKGFKQGDQNLSPMTRPVASKSAFNMPDNGVSAASSAKLQKAGMLPGRLGAGGAHKKLVA
jgi:hypothetical protein